MLPGATYTLSAWVRGKLNAQASGGGWTLRLLAYDRQGAFSSSYTVASDGGGSLTTAWQQRSGTVTLPGNAMTVRVELFDYMTDGWVAMDDVSLTGATVTKHYYLGSQRVAMRQGGVLTYLHGDHLGSASLATDVSGTKVSEQRYLPYGGTRSGSMPGDRQYTGQRREASLGFYDYVARQFDPFLDGSGDNTVWQPGLWQLHELEIVLQAVKDFARVAGGVEATRRAIGGATIERIRKGSTAHWGFGQITLADYTFNQSGLRKIFGPTIGIVHELAHYWDWKTGNLWAKTFNLPEMVRDFPKGVGPTAYGRMNSTEGWAESVTGYIYPVYFAILRAEGSKVENVQQPLQYGTLTINFSLPGLTPRNRGYVEQQFQGLAVAQ